MNPAGNPTVDMIWGGFQHGFLIYGPVMLIGLHALELASPKKAAGTAAAYRAVWLPGRFGGGERD